MCVSKRKAFWAEKGTRTKALSQRLAGLRNCTVASVVVAARGRGRMGGSEVRGNEGAACVGPGAHGKEKHGRLL